jgi:hypothetical protein
MSERGAAYGDDQADELLAAPAFVTVQPPFHVRRSITISVPV